MYFNNLGIRARVLIGLDKETKNQELYVDIKSNETGEYQQEHEKIVNWQINGYPLMEIDGIFPQFKIDKRLEIERLLKSAKNQEFETEEEMETLMSAILQLFEEYLIRTEYPFANIFRQINDNYLIISNIDVQIRPVVRINAFNITEVDAENKFVFGFITTKSEVQFNANLSRILDSLRVVANILNMEKTTLHYLCNFEIKVDDDSISDIAKRLISEDGAVISLLRLSDNKTTELLNLQQFTMLNQL